MIPSALQAKEAPALELPRYFQYLFLLAVWCFHQEKVDVAIVEVGIGGALDATNVVHPTVCAITTLDLDHRDTLGPTINHIARAVCLTIPGIVASPTSVLTSPFLLGAESRHHQTWSPRCDGASTRLSACNHPLNSRSL